MTLRGPRPRGMNAKDVQPFRVPTDPRPRLDGLCVCGCGRPLTPVALRHQDPFATGACCRDWYLAREQRAAG